ncbi:MAG: FAD-dependent oxidoreductase [Deltaproteobacteria bacterium]|nr:FAD-dependent oxidoreductase [Deltaproteobacteria bacterium]
MTTTLVESLAAEAAALLDEGRNDDAIDRLRGPAAPAHGVLCARLARAYHQRGDARGDVYSARFFASRALELGHDTPEVRAILAVAAFRKGRFDQAEPVLRARAAAGGDPGAAALYGIALFHLGRAAEAAEWLDRAVAADPGQADWAAARDAAREAAASGRPPPDSDRWTPVAPSLGGPRDVRPAGIASADRGSALSVLAGDGTHPKDFAWTAASVPCQAACPAGTDIPAYLRAIHEADPARAYRINLEDNVFPGVLGRVCARPCEPACRHGREGLGEPVAICGSKRAAADLGRTGPVLLAPWFGPSGRRVAVVGAGPAGLAAARELARLGHAVTVFERHRVPGGMLIQGIPVFRLPREVIDAEVGQVRGQGVEIRCGVDVGRDLPFADLVRDSDAVVLAAGTLRPNVPELPGVRIPGVRHGLDFLLDVNEGRPIEPGDHVVVIGGGFTAMDCARAAARLRGTPARRPNDGAVRVFYRRSRTEMLVAPGEVEELHHEGIPMEFQVMPLECVQGGDGRVRAVRFVRTALGAPDASGRRRPEPVPGSAFEVPATLVLLATGQFPDAAFLHDDPEGRALVGEDGWLVTGAGHATAHPKVFAAGDFATGARSIIDAIGHAKAATRAVDRFLCGTDRLRDVVEVTDLVSTGRIREMDFVPRVALPTLALPAREAHAEVETGFAADQAVEETQRCYACHVKFEIDPRKCILCGWCVKAKPRPDCIVEVARLLHDEQDRIAGFQRARSSEEVRRVFINAADCIRCGACVDACPVDAISLQRAARRTRVAGEG